MLKKKLQDGSTREPNYTKFALLFYIVVSTDRKEFTGLLGEPQKKCVLLFCVLVFLGNDLRVSML